MDHHKLWKILRDGNTRPPYLSPKKPVRRSKSNRTGHGTKLGKEFINDVYHHPASLTFMCRVIHHSKCLAGWITNWNQDYQWKYQQPPIWKWYHSNDRKWRGTKKTLDDSERGEWKSWLESLKPKIQKTKIVASCPITSWQIDGEKVETMTDFIFLGSKITEDSDCSHENKRHLLLGSETMTNLDSIFKSRDITLPTKAHIVKAIVFSSSHIWIWEWDHEEGWAPKNWWCWRRLLRVPWTARRSNQSILKEINPEYSLEGLMLKLKLQYFGHLMQRTVSLEMTLVLGKIEGRRRRRRQRNEMVGWHHWHNGHEFE